MLIVDTGPLIAIAERLAATRIATLGRAHFQVVRPAHCDAFELVPTPLITAPAPDGPRDLTT